MPQESTQIAKNKCREAKLQTLEDIWKVAQPLVKNSWSNVNNKKWLQFAVWVSEVFAEKSSGTAYLLIPDIEEPKKSKHDTSVILDTD